MSRRGPEKRNTISTEDMPLKTHEKCSGCKYINFGTEDCALYYDPQHWWNRGDSSFCPSATHIEVEKKKETQKLNPLKASKRQLKTNKIQK